MQKEKKLNRESFSDVAKMLNNKKILGIYHPSGSRIFYNYFKDLNEKGKTIRDREIKGDVTTKIRKFIEGDIQYGFLKYKNNKIEIKP